jgi:hypothetical protein
MYQSKYNSQAFIISLLQLTTIKKTTSSQLSTRRGLVDSENKIILALDNDSAEMLREGNESSEWKCRKRKKGDRFSR